MYTAISPVGNQPGFDGIFVAHNVIVTFVLPEFSAAAEFLIGVTRRAPFEQVQGLTEDRGVSRLIMIGIITTRHIHQQVNMIGHDTTRKQVIMAAIQPPDFIYDQLGNFRLTQLGETIRHVVQPLRAYPNNPAARKAIKPQATWRKARYCSGFFSQRISKRRNRLSQL